MPEGNWVQASDGSIGPFPGTLGFYITAGTETGLGIPPPPKSLSCAYQPDTNEVVLNWENPPGGYDRIVVIADGFPHGIRGNSGNLTTYKLPAGTLGPWRHGEDNAARLHGGVDFCLIGIRGGTPSNGAAITFRDYGQEELSGLPFTTGGVAPNWTAWSVGGTQTATLEQKVKAQKTTGRWPEIKIADDGKTAVHDPKWIRSAADKPFIQVIKTTSPEAVAGVCRKFLGLTPGHTYRLSTRLYGLDMPKAQGDWSFSLHAVPAGQGKSDLTVQQMAGSAALPDGKAGPEADRIALYAPGVSPVPAQPQPTTRPKRRPASAPADEPVADLVTGDITLPEGADTITVWVRHQAAHSTGVGLDWIRLEDITGK